MRPAAAAAELLGTGVVAFTVGCNVSAPNAPIEWQIASIACSLLAMMSAFGSISGGHLNPAVSLSMLCLGKIQLADAAAYLILQVAGAILGMLFASSIFQVSPPPMSSASLHGADLVVEGIFVLMLNFVILCVTGRRNHPESEPNQFYSVAASAALAAGLGSTQLKGGVLNPALTIALRLAGFGGFEARGVVGLVIAQLVAALLAAGLVQLLRPEEQLSTESFQNYIPKFGTRLGSELIGTTFLILTIGLSLQDQRRWWAPACALVGLVYALGDLSGGHFNPAVTTAVVLSRTRMLTTSDLLGFWASQVLGSVLATLALMALVPHFQWDLSPQAPFQAGAAYIMEFTFCIVLCLAVLSASCIKGIASDFSRNFYFGLAVGVALLAGSLSCGRISGACLNPAVALIVVVSSVLRSDTSTAFYASNYCLAQLFAGVTSAVLFRSTHAKEYASKSRTARLPFQMA